MGTPGTILGISTYLKGNSKDITIVGAPPQGSARIPGIRKWSPDYIPKFFIDRKELLSLNLMNKMSQLQHKELPKKKVYLLV